VYDDGIVLLNMISCFVDPINSILLGDTKYSPQVQGGLEVGLGVNVLVGVNVGVGVLVGVLVGVVVGR
jgi:hypothetical protein